VVLHFSTPFGSVYSPRINVVQVVRDPATGAVSFTAPVQFNAATLVYAAFGWRDHPLPHGPGNNNFSLKRANSIAQTLFYTVRHSDGTIETVHDGYPPPNGPTQFQNHGLLMDGFYIYGAGWGNNGDTFGVELNQGGGWVPWTADSTLTLRAGSYPVSSLPYVRWTDQNPFFWETNLGINTSP
jgi:hypothetical protein